MSEQKILFRRGTKAALELKLIGDNKPKFGEPIAEINSDNNIKFKIGDGIRDYKDLPYVSGSEAIEYTAGDGISIVDRTISVDQSIARQSALNTESTARQAKDTELSGRIDALEGRGRFLSSWNAETGLPGDYPAIEIGETYTYKSGDYYLVNKIAEVNKKPKGSVITRTQSGYIIESETETEALSVGDQYTYSSTGWVLIHTPQKETAWGSISGKLNDQTDLSNALQAKQNVISTTNKLYSDLVDSTGQTNLFVNASEKQEIAKVQDKADKTYVDTELAKKQDALTPGTNITISGNTISAVDTKYTAGTGIQISTDNEIHVNNYENLADKTFVDTKVATEKTRAESAETGLSTRISTIESDYLKQADKTALETEIAKKSTVSAATTGSSTTEAKYITIDGTEWKLPEGSIISPTIVTQKDCENGADHSIILATIENPKQGDIAIIKEAIDAEATKRQYTAYIYDTNAWAAMDGNYNAENVYFANDLIYTKAIGELPAVPSTGSATLQAKGKNVKQILSTILALRKQPEVNEPSVVLGGQDSNKDLEIGTTVSKSGTFTSALSAGSYTYGPATGVQAQSWSSEIKYTEGKSGTIITGTTASTNYNYSFRLGTDGERIKVNFSATATHNAGTIAKDNLGDNSNPVKQIAAGSKSSQADAIYTCYRKMFYGTRTDKESLDSAKIRGLQSEKSSSKTITVVIPIGAMRTVISVPNNKVVTSVKDVNASSAEIISSFEISEVSVNGAENYTPISYNTYVLDYSEALGTANTYKVTIA